MAGPMDAMMQQQAMGGQPQMAPQGPPSDPSQMGGPGGPPMDGDAPMPQANPPMDQPEEQAGDYSKDEVSSYIDMALRETNLAKKIDEDVLTEIGQKLVEGFNIDLDSREDWMKANKEWMELALLVRKNKSHPWPKASNIKFPLLATAAMQYSARAYPALVPADGNIVKTRVAVGNATAKEYDAAQRISRHMSYQIMECIPNWEEDMDKLLMTHAILGICFKKTYHSAADKCHVSKIVYPENLVINYYAKSLEGAYRKSEVLYYTDNELLEKTQNDEEYLDQEYPSPSTPDELKQVVTNKNAPGKVDESTPHTFIEVHTFWDLDDDGYEEPYIITIHLASKKVARIQARWCSDDVQFDEKGKNIVRIKPLEYYTDFPFIPNPDGSIYALGFGTLLGPLNESSNTLINLLVDAGVLNNMQSGFIAKGLRIKMGDNPLRPGEWRAVNATGDDLNKSLFPIPSKEPSAVLFNLLNMLITAGNQLASIAEIFVGKMPGQNTTATTTQETIQQGMAVFTAIYKRVYRSLKKEICKIYWLNRLYPESHQEEAKLSGIPLEGDDYELPEWTIIPAADPSGDSATLKMQKLQQIGQLLSLGTINPQVYTKMILQANEIPDVDQLMQQPPQQEPPPDPKAATEQLKQQGMQQKAQLDAQAAEQAMQHKERSAQLEAQALEQKTNMEMQSKAMDLRYQQQKEALDIQNQRMQSHLDQITSTMERLHAHQKATLELGVAAAKHDQAMAHADKLNTQKVAHAKAKAAAVPKESKKSKGD